MTTSPLPIDEFAKRLRTKYPGAYDSLSDSQLVQKVVDKYPDYKQHIASMAPTQAEQQPERSVTDAYDPKAEGVTQKFLGSMGASIAGIPGNIYHAVADPLTPEEESDFKGHTRVPGEVTLERLTGARSIVDAAKTYANPQTRPTAEGIASVLPEALGTGVGNAMAAYLPGAAKDAHTALRGAIYSPEGTLKPGVETASKIAGGAAGAGVGAVTGHGGGAFAGAYGGAKLGPSITKTLFPKIPTPEPELGSTGNPGPMSEIPNRLPANLRGDPFLPKVVPAPEPELGSPENPGFMSKLPARLPPNLRGDPFAPKVEETAEAGRQADAASEPNPNNVAVVPEPRAPLPSDRPGSAWSLTRTKGLPEAAQRGQPGAADVLRQVGQPVVMTSRGGDIESPNMQALRDSLGITEAHPDAYSPNAPAIPQGNPTPFGPSVTQSWLKPRRPTVLQ